MTKEELIQFLKENLKVYVNDTSGPYEELKCEDCVYNHNDCKAKFKRCMANVISPVGVTHLIWCEKDYIDDMKAKILEVMELIHKK